MGNYSSGPGTGDAHVGRPDQFFPKGPAKPKTDGGSYTKGGGSSAPNTSARPKLRPKSGDTKSSPKSGTPGKKYTDPSVKSGTPGKKYKEPSVKSGKPGKKGKPKDFFYDSKGGPPKADTTSGSKKSSGPMRFSAKR